MVPEATVGQSLAPALLADERTLPSGTTRGRKRPLVAVGRALQRVEWLLVAAAAPVLLFPGRAAWLGCLLIGITWLARRVGSGRWSVATRVDRAILILSGMLLVSLIPSVRLDYSMPKFWGLLFGLATFYAVVNTCRVERAVRRAELALLASGVGVAIVGLVGGATPPDKLIDDRGVYAALPHLVTSVQSSTIVVQGINPNEIGGALILVVPVAFALACRPGRLRLPALAAGVMMMFAVLLTQSRAALLGLVVCACVGVVLVAGRRGALLVTLALVVGVVVLIRVDGADDLRQRVLGDGPAAGVESLGARAELWQRGLAMALDMPLTGIGLNTLPVILQQYYPTIIHDRTTQLPHVHNMYLQTLLDFGLAGLAALLVILAAAVAAGLTAFRAGKHRFLAVGLLLGLCAHATYSLVDAVTLGAKPGPLLWVVLGLLFALGSATARPTPPGDRSIAAVHAAQWRRRWIWAVLVIPLTPLAVAGVSLNAATLLLHRRVADTAFLTTDLQVARAVAVGPLAPRVAVADALAADLRGDVPAELDAFAQAATLGGWDPSVGLRLGDLRLATGDRPGALDAWRAAGALPALLSRASTAPLDEAIQWYALAQAMAPDDWRPYAGAANVLEASDPNRALAYLAEAVRLRGNDPVRTALARRLLDPSVVLPEPVALPRSSIDADLLIQASHLLLARQDLSGALLASQTSTTLDPRSRPAWLALAEALERVGRLAAAAQARGRADTLS